MFVEFHLKDLIFGRSHAKLLVGIAGATVLRMHVKPDPADVASSAGEVLEMLEERAENTLASKIYSDVDTLQPPEIAVTPVTPFVGDHHLANHFSLGFGDVV